MMMPVYPGAPWLPKFKGVDDDVKYCEWKEQMLGLLASQDLSETRKVDILLGALVGEAKRQINVLEDNEKDTVRKIVLYLDSLYGDTTPIPVLKAQFFRCTQRSDEPVSLYILRLKELYCRLRRYDPDDAPSDAALKEQLLLGLQEGPSAQALRTYARHNPDQDFSSIRKEALLLDTDRETLQPEVTCAAVSGPCAPLSSQDTSWRETMKREIMEDVKTQMSGLTQELLRELKPLLQQQVAERQPPSQAKRGRQRQHPAAAINQWDEQGRPICRLCKQSGHISRFCRTPTTSQSPLN